MIIKAINVGENCVVSGYVMEFKKSVYSFPYQSSQYNIGHYKLTDKMQSGLPSTKAILFEKNNDTNIIIPLALPHLIN